MKQWNLPGFCSVDVGKVFPSVVVSSGELPFSSWLLIVSKVRLSLTVRMISVTVVVSILISPQYHLPSHIDDGPLTHQEDVRSLKAGLEEVFTSCQALKAPHSHQSKAAPRRLLRHNQRRQSPFSRMQCSVHNVQRSVAVFSVQCTFTICSAVWQCGGAWSNILSGNLGPAPWQSSHCLSFLEESTPPAYIR